MAAIGMDVPGWPKETYHERYSLSVTVSNETYMNLRTPPTKITASNPSLNTVINGNKNKAHFPFLAFFLVSLSSSSSSLTLALFTLSPKACANLILHLTREWSILRKARPMMYMRMAAMMLKTPSQICSALPQRLLSLV